MYFRSATLRFLTDRFPLEPEGSVENSTNSEFHFVQDNGDHATHCFEESGEVIGVHLLRIPTSL